MAAPVRSGSMGVELPGGLIDEGEEPAERRPGSWRRRRGTGLAGLST